MKIDIYYLNTDKITEAYEDYHNGISKYKPSEFSVSTYFEPKSTDVKSYKIIKENNRESDFNWSEVDEDWNFKIVNVNGEILFVDCYLDVEKYFLLKDIYLKTEILGDNTSHEMFLHKDYAINEGLDKFIPSLKKLRRISNLESLLK